jgi:hypothetical protein
MFSAPLSGWIWFFCACSLSVANNKLVAKSATDVGKAAARWKDAQRDLRR